LVQLGVGLGRSSLTAGTKSYKSSAVLNFCQTGLLAQLDVAKFVLPFEVPSRPPELMQRLWQASQGAVGQIFTVTSKFDVAKSCQLTYSGELVDTYYMYSIGLPAKVSVELSGTGVAFAPTSCGVAFAPAQGGGRGECDPCFCVAGAIVSEPRKDLFQLR